MLAEERPAPSSATPNSAIRDMYSLSILALSDDRETYVIINRIIFYS